MNNTKIIIALVAIAALTLAAVGFVAAQIAANQIYTNTNTGLRTTSPNDGGFWGWIGSCFGIRTSQPYNYQYVAPPPVTNSSVPTPYQPYEPYQGGYGYGYGPCMGGW
jgi:hypothetical protein